MRLYKNICFWYCKTWLCVYWYIIHNVLALVWYLWDYSESRYSFVITFTDLKLLLTLLFILKLIIQCKYITHTTQKYYSCFSPHKKMFLSKVFLGHGYSGRPARYGYPPEPVSLSQCLLAERGSGGRGGEESGPLIVMTSLFIDLHFISLLCFSGETSSRGRRYKSIYFLVQRTCVCCYVCLSTLAFLGYTYKYVTW